MKKFIRQSNEVILKEKGKKSSFYSFKVKYVISDFKHDEDESQLRKKIKLENDIITDKIKEHYEDIDISGH